METESVRKLIDICAEAAHLERMLPKLSAGLTPRCIRVVDQVASLTRQNETVRVSDISEMLDVTRPGITKVLGDLDGMGYITKTRDTGRFTTKGNAIIMEKDGTVWSVPVQCLYASLEEAQSDRRR